ncbi:MAG: hypothetical protein RBQ97_05360, partial [Acholeplasma sp.]|nr:hypothetical protein [Acholeplasma sp.]
SIKVLDSIVTNTKIKGSSSSVTIYDKRSKDLIGFSAKTSSGSIKIFDNSYKEKSDDKNKYDIYYDISISSGSIKIYN